MAEDISYIDGSDERGKQEGLLREENILIPCKREQRDNKADKGLSNGPVRHDLFKAFGREL